MKYSDIKLSVEEICDGRTFADALHDRWIKRIRDDISMDFVGSGFNGYYFLYKEATVKDGSVIGTTENQGKYALPSDFIDDLKVFYDTVYVPKASSTNLDIIRTVGSLGTPAWFRMAGVEFQFIPWPDTAGKEIKLVYNGMPDPINEPTAEDYFMKRFPDLHIFGMGKYAAASLGRTDIADWCEKHLDAEKQKLQLHNRRHWLKAAKMRFQNWDEYEEYRDIFFPQFKET
jgi:hypothetical protein